MKRPKENKAREDRIAMEAVVDAYNESERAMGWHYYLEGKIKPPFAAKCVVRRSISPLKVDQVVTVLGMAPEADCETEMFVLDRVQRRYTRRPYRSARSGITRSGNAGSIR